MVPKVARELNFTSTFYFIISPRGGSSFYSQESQTNVKSPATNLPNFAEGENEDGEPSLAVTASLSHNESSVGIIDLDAIQCKNFLIV